MGSELCTTDAYVRAGELKDVAYGLLQDHYDGHLDKEVRETSTGVTLNGWIENSNVQTKFW